MKTAIVVLVFFAGYVTAGWNDERMVLLERENTAAKLCFPAFENEIASLTSENGRFTCAIKRGHTVVTRFEV